MRLLLHLCCGPCAIVPVARLRAAGYEVTGYFANPNIHPLMEYLRRREAAAAFAHSVALPMLWQDDVVSVTGWLSVVFARGLASNTEQARCAYCTASRLALTQAAAIAHGFDVFSTSLLYSRYQQHDVIREQGEALGARVSVPFVYDDFRDGWQAGIEQAKALNMYRQPYCGCIFSEEERYASKVLKLAQGAG